MKQVTILIVEDEAIIADSIAFALMDFGYNVLEPAMSYDEAIASIEEYQPDIAILDIRLQGERTGIDLGSLIHKKYDFPYLFLTSNSDKMTFDQAKIAKPSAFLVKPYVKEELYAAVELALVNYASDTKRFINEDNLVVKDALFIKQKKRFIRANFEDIRYIQSDGVYLDIYVEDTKYYTVRGTLNEYADKLNNDFIRVHRSYIVNLHYLEALENNVAIIDGAEVPIGKRHRADLVARLNLA